MQVKETKGSITIQLDRAEADLLRLALMRAGFEDTPRDRLDDILGFTIELRRQLGELESEA